MDEKVNRTFDGKILAQKSSPFQASEMKSSPRFAVESQSQHEQTHDSTTERSVHKLRSSRNLQAASYELTSPNGDLNSLSMRKKESKLAH